MDAYQYGHGFSRQVLFLRDQAEKRFLDAFDLREDLTRQVKSALQANPELLGLSLVFEPNGLDGKDELFAGQSRSWAATTRAALPCTGRNRRRAK
jgi:methyl-accepting chemotaxis protein